jgi:uncharacterized membrane protein YgcG
MDLRTQAAGKGIAGGRIRGGFAMSSLGRSAVIVVAWLALVGRAAAVAPEIRDEGKFFSADAVKKANEIIRDIYKKYGKDLLIETFPSVPAADKDKVKTMTNDEKKTYFRKWAIQRAEHAVVRGVYILVCKEPTRLETLVARQVRSVFDEKADKKLREILLADFRNKRFDEGLLAAVKFVQETFEKAKPEKKD